MENMDRIKAKKKIIKIMKFKKNFRRALMYIATTATSIAMSGNSNAEAASVNYSNSGDTQGKDLFSPELGFNTMFDKINEAANVDQEAEIDKRVDWLFSKQLENLDKHFNTLKSNEYRFNTKKKGAYINKNFFKKAWVKSGNHGAKFYCMSAIFGSLNEIAPKFGNEVKDIVPGHASISCHAIMSLAKDNKYKNFVKKYSGINRSKKAFDECKPGDVILIRSRGNTSSGWHAITYTGKSEDNKPQIISFNREYKGNFKAPKEFVVVQLNAIAKANLRENTKTLNKFEFLEAMNVNRPVEIDNSIARPHSGNTILFADAQKQILDNKAKTFKLKEMPSLKRDNVDTLVNPVNKGTILFADAQRAMFNKNRQRG